MTETETRWVARIAAWRASGKSATEFCERQGFAGTTLTWWASRLGLGRRAAKTAIAPVGLARVEVRRTQAASSGVTLGVGSVRIHLESGFDQAVLRGALDVVESRGAR